MTNTRWIAGNKIIFESFSQQNYSNFLFSKIRLLKNRKKQFKSSIYKQCSEKAKLSPVNATWNGTIKWNKVTKKILEQLLKTQNVLKIIFKIYYVLRYCWYGNRRIYNKWAYKTHFYLLWILNLGRKNNKKCRRRKKSANKISFYATGKYFVYAHKMKQF